MVPIALVFDIDGSLREVGVPDVPKEVKGLLRSLPSHVHVFVASGRDGAYCQEVADQIGGDGWFGETGAVWRFKGEPIQAIPRGDVTTLLEAINFSKTGSETGSAILNGKTVRVLFDPRPRQATFSLRPLANPGDESHSWELKESLEAMIRARGLKVGISGPHADQNIDLVPHGANGPIDKGIVPGVWRQRFPGAEIWVFGDGRNDIPIVNSVEVSRVFTFSNGHPDLQLLVRNRGGFVASLPGPRGGCEEAIRWAVQHIGLEVIPA